MQYAVSRGFGHPWNREGEWDLLEIKADSDMELDKAIALSSNKFWKLWIRDNTGNIQAVMYKPSGATSEWKDPIDT